MKLTPTPLRQRAAAAVFTALAVGAASMICATAPADAAVARPLDLTTVRYDPPGRDYQTNSYINQEYVVVKNVGTTTLALAGWQIKDAQNHTFVFPRGVALAPGRTFTIRTGIGTNTASTLYWKQTNYVWNNTGDTARLINSRGAVVETCGYAPTTAGSKTC